MFTHSFFFTIKNKPQNYLGGKGPQNPPCSNPLPWAGTPLTIPRLLQAPSKPGLEHFQGWVIHSCSGKPVPMSNHPHNHSFPHNFQYAASRQRKYAKPLRKHLVNYLLQKLVLPISSRIRCVFLESKKKKKKKFNREKSQIFKKGVLLGFANWHLHLAKLLQMPVSLCLVQCLQEAWEGFVWLFFLYSKPIQQLRFITVIKILLLCIVNVIMHSKKC